MTLAIIIVLLFLIVIAAYNSLIRKRNQTQNAFASIDAMLKKRYDLIPNLVATVQQYAEHEKSTFTQVAELRNKPYESLSTGEKTALDTTLLHAGTRFLAVAENYPQLRASENFGQLQRSLNETEEQLSAARRTYNACVTDYNNAVQSFPLNLLASACGFTCKELFVIPDAERSNPDVKSLFK